MKSKIANALGYDMDGPNPCRDKNGNLLLFEIDDNGRTRDPLANGVKADSTYKSKKATGSPEIYGQLGQAEAEGKTVEGLNRMMDELLPGRAALENLSIADLNKALDPTRLFRQDSPYIRAPQPEGPAPEKQVEAPVQEKQAEEKAEGPAVQKEEAPEVGQPAVL